MLPISLFAAHPVFELDKKWQLVDPSKIEPSCIDYMFLKNSHSVAGLRLVMAHEKTSGTLDDYLNACVKMNNQTPGTEARRLGKYKTKSGCTGELLEIESDGILGRMRAIQFITLHSEMAHILTVTTDKKSFLKEQKELMSVFDSLKISDDPLADFLPEKMADTLKMSIDQMRSRIRSLATKHVDKYLTSKAPLPLQKAASEDNRMRQIHLLEEKISLNWRETKGFKGEVWPGFAKLIEKHFSEMSPIWQFEALKYCAQRLLQGDPQP